MISKLFTNWCEILWAHWIYKVWKILQKLGVRSRTAVLTRWHIVGIKSYLVNKWAKINHSATKRLRLHHRWVCERFWEQKHLIRSCLDQTESDARQQLLEGCETICGHRDNTDWSPGWRLLPAGHCLEGKASGSLVHRGYPLPGPIQNVLRPLQDRERPLVSLGLQYSLTFWPPRPLTSGSLPDPGHTALYVSDIFCFCY